MLLGSRGGRRCRAGGADFGVGELVLLLPLHPPILEPDLHLALRQAHGVRDLHPPAPGQVPVEVEFLLQLQSLLAGVGSAGPLGHSSIVTSGDWKGWEKKPYTRKQAGVTSRVTAFILKLLRSSTERNIS